MRITQRSTGRSLIFTPKNPTGGRPYKNYKDLAVAAAGRYKPAKGSSLNHFSKPTIA